MTSAIEEALMDLHRAEQMQDSEKALQVAAEALDKLTPEDRGKLLTMPAVAKLMSDAEEKAAKTAEPGTTVCDSRGYVVARIPETAAHMKETRKMVTWTPMQNRHVSVEGVSIWTQAGVPVTTPEIFRDVAMEAWQAEQNQLETVKEIMKRNFGENSTVLYGDGTPA